MLLGRTAASLFWMARYVERAENLARLLEVGYRISLMPQAGQGHREEWQATLASCGCEHSFFKSYDEVTTANVIQHLLFDDANSSSVRSSIRTARNNGRAVRTALTRDVWESLNSTWNELAPMRASELTTDKLPGFLDWVRQRSLMFRGALVGTMLRNDTFYFSQLGSFIERADSTARILDVKYYVLLPGSHLVGSGIDSRQWVTVLRSVSAHRSYRWHYRRSGYTAWNVADYLILREEMPRSLVFCYRFINDSLDGLAEVYGNRYRCHEMAADTYRRLRTGRMDEIFQSGLHEFLADFMIANNRLSAEIGGTYNFP